MIALPASSSTSRDDFQIRLPSRGPRRGGPHMPPTATSRTWQETKFFKDDEEGPFAVKTRVGSRPRCALLAGNWRGQATPRPSGLTRAWARPSRAKLCLNFKRSRR